MPGERGATWAYMGRGHPGGRADGGQAEVAGADSRTGGGSAGGRPRAGAHGLLHRGRRAARPGGAGACRLPPRRAPPPPRVYLRPGHAVRVPARRRAAALYGGRAAVPRRGGRPALLPVPAADAPDRLLHASRGPSGARRDAGSGAAPRGVRGDRPGCALRRAAVRGRAARRLPSRGRLPLLVCLSLPLHRRAGAQQRVGHRRLVHARRDPARSPADLPDGRVLRAAVRRAARAGVGGRARAYVSRRRGRAAGAAPGAAARPRADRRPARCGRSAGSGCPGCRSARACAGSRPH
ncbi:MAG: hypothetical protein BWY52_00399 [Chloroflexi bacterium ADurb.Bin325]|nr:MAG: hypothetical protein BWY52_00399 [Chloroflexi bacterium ADurb.Bin325]